MSRLLCALLALVSSAFAAPAAAQSLALLSAPVVFVKAPVVQQSHHGRRIAALSAAPAASAAAPAPNAVGAFVPRPEPRFEPGLRPRGIDRSRRDYNRALASYGPFVVLDGARAALVGETDAASPQAFRAMLRAYPGLAQIDMVECPGTRDDRANLALGRMIRAARLATHVPAIGSVRSGAVELFLAGAERDIAEGAEFAVHSWMDDYGREPADFAESAPENRQYLDYYREMGMSEAQARAFYAFTNSVPHRRARWLDARTMRGWLARPQQFAAPARRTAPAPAPAPMPRLAYASLALSWGAIRRLTGQGASLKRAPL